MIGHMSDPTNSGKSTSPSVSVKCIRHGATYSNWESVCIHCEMDHNFRFPWEHWEMLNVASNIFTGNVTYLRDQWLYGTHLAGNGVTTDQATPPTKVSDHVTGLEKGEFSV